MGQPRRFGSCLANRYHPGLANHKRQRDELGAAQRTFLETDDCLDTIANGTEFRSFKGPLHLGRCPEFEDKITTSAQPMKLLNTEEIMNRKNGASGVLQTVLDGEIAAGLARLEISRQKLFAEAELYPWMAEWPEV